MDNKYNVTSEDISKLNGELSSVQESDLDKLDGITVTSEQINEAVANIRFLQTETEFNRLTSNSTATRGTLWTNSDVIPNNCYIKELRFKAIADTNNYNTNVKVVVMTSAYVVRSVNVFNVNLNISETLVTLPNLNIYAMSGDIIGLQLLGDSSLRYGNTSGVNLYNNGVVNVLENSTYTPSQTIPNTSISMYIKISYSQLVTQVVNSVNNYLKNKTVVAIGDSMVKGHSLTDIQTWLAKLSNRNNMKYINYGINGSYLINNGANSVHDRVTNVSNPNYINPVNPDYILIFIGTNDAGNSVTIGNSTSTLSTEFYGALKAVIDNLQTRYPTSKIGFITPYNRIGGMSNYITAIETVCSMYGIPIFNNIKDGNINWNNTAQVNTLTLMDTYHLNEAGMEYVSYKYEDFLRRL